MTRLFISLFLFILLSFVFYWTLVDRLFEPAMVEMDDEALITVARGPLHLAAERLRGADPQEQAQVMAQLQTHFGDVLRLRQLEELELLPEDVQQLKETPIFVLEHASSDGEPIAFHLFEPSSSVLSYGPILEPAGRDLLDTGLQMGWLLLATLLLIYWIARLYRKSLTLKHAADAFGRGQFATRTHLHGKGFMDTLGQTFDQMAAHIEKLLETKNQTINAVSHELRTPLARLAFALHYLREKAPEEISATINDIEEELRQLNELVEELLKYGRLDYQLSSEPQEVLPLYPWLEKVVASFQRFDTDLRLELPQVQTSPQVQLIPKFFEKAVSTLLLNAQQHRTQNSLLYVTLMDDQVWIHVADDGPGIPTHQRASALKPFVRATSEGDRGHGGWGLGLTLAQRIVQWHQGELRIGTSASGGAEISLSLPIHKAADSGKISI